MVRIRTVRAKAVSPLRSRLRFASARQVATAVQDALRCWMLREVEHWRVCRVAADHRSALRTPGRLFLSAAALI